MPTPGDLFIERDAARPKCFQVQDDAHHSGWLPVQHNLDPHDLDSHLTNLGWTFFYMANVIRKSALSFDRDKGTTAALKRVMASVREEGCNSLQIQAVEARSFCGIPYVSVSAHPRHIQKGLVFSRHREPEPAFVELRPKTLVT